MLNVKLLTTKVVVSMVAVGSLTFAGTGVVGATPQPATQGVKHVSAARLCNLYQRHLAFGIKNQARYAATTAKFAALADKVGHVC